MPQHPPSDDNARFAQVMSASRVPQKAKPLTVTGENSSAAEERSCCAIFDDVAQITSARILMQCLETEAVAKNNIQELTFLARKKLTTKTFFAGARRDVFLNMPIFRRLNIA